MCVCVCVAVRVCICVCAQELIDYEATKASATLSTAAVEAQPKEGLGSEASCSRGERGDAEEGKYSSRWPDPE